MGEQDDRAFGEAAVKRGFITGAQLDEYLELVVRVTQAGLTRSLADILLEKGALTEFQVELIHRSLTAVGEKRVVGGFEILKKIGEGGMGAVYRAQQISMDRVVALKLLPERLAKDEQFTARFLREARIAAKLDHANIVRGIDVGKDGNDYYFAMEFVEGESVADVIRREGTIPEGRALSIAIQVARALEHAWELKLIHRDIKPDNILLTKNDVAKLADMGLAKQTTAESTVMTRTGVAMGTPLYMSPEQARGEKHIDIRTDIYSLGATLYHMVTGDAPFSGSTAAVVITKHLTESPVPAHERNPKVSGRTSKIIAKTMEKKAQDRYSNPTELLKDLERTIDGKEPQAAPEAVAQTLVESAGEIALAQAEMARSRRESRRWLVPAVAVGVVTALAAGSIAGWLVFGRVEPRPSAESGAGPIDVVEGLAESPAEPQTPPFTQRTGGAIIENPRTPKDYYHNARFLELSGDFARARQAYASYFAFQQEFIDPHLDYSTLLRMQDGAEGARETYAALSRRDGTTACRLAGILLQPKSPRLSQLERMHEEEPDHAPVVYFLSVEYSWEKLGDQTLADKRKEKEYLERFQKLDKAGGFLRYYIDKKRAERIRGDVEKRLKVLLSQPVVSMKTPVKLSAMKTNQGWSITFQIMEWKLKEVLYRFGEKGPFKSTGHVGFTSPQTGLPMPNTAVMVPLSQTACKVFVKYTDSAGAEHGPYELFFDPDEEALRSGKQILSFTATSWVAMREYDGKLLLYFTHLLCYRDALKEIRYSLDEPTLDRSFPIPPPAPANEISATAKIYLEIPKSTRAVYVKLRYRDGTESQVGTFERR